MKASVTVTFSCLFLGVAVLYARLSPVSMPGAGTNPAEALLRVLPLLRDGGVRWIEIQNTPKKETIALEKQEEGWQLLTPVNYPADPLMAEGLATALKLSSKARRLLPEKGWEEYGLLNPDLKIGVEAEPGKKRYLYLGDPSPVGNFVYARWEDEKEYFLVQADLKRAFERSVYSLRLKQIFRTSMQDVSKIHVRTLSADYEILKKGGKWFWIEPIPILGRGVSKSQSDEILGAIADLYVKDFLDQEKGTPVSLGFMASSPSIQLWGKGKKPEVFRIGREAAAQDSYYGMRENEKTFLLAARGNIRGLFQMMETMAQAKN